MLSIYLKNESNYNLSVKPCRQCFLLTLKIHTSVGDPEGADRVLQDMLRLYNSKGDEDFRPDIKHFVTVVMSYFQFKRDPDMVYKADATFHRMLDLAEKSQDAALVPKDSLVQHIIALWAESYDQEAGERAEAVLLRVNGFRNEKQWPNGMPPLKFFELIMENWSNSGSRKGVSRIQRIQSFVRQIYADNESAAETIPPSFGYLPLLRSLSRRTAVDPDPRRKDEAESIFREYQAHFGTKHVSDTDIILAYKALMMAYDLHRGIEHQETTERTQLAFDELMRLHQRGVITKEPDATVYSILANAWAKNGGVTKVKKIIQEIMSKNFENTVLTTMYNHLLHALMWCKDPTAVDEAEAVFREMEMAQSDSSAAPNIKTYNIILMLLGNSPHPEASVKAEMYLQKLKDSYAATGDENLKPSRTIYTKTMKVLLKSSDPTARMMARAIVHEMIGLAAEGDVSVKPNAATFLALLQDLARHDVPGKAEKAREIVALMKEAGVPADSSLEAEACKLGALQ